MKNHRGVLGRTVRGAVGGLVLLGGMASAAAADFSFTGNLLVGRQVQFFDFTLAADATVNIRTFHFAGGTNAAGTTFPAGGFDPALSLFNATTGTLVAFNDDAFSFDSGISGALAAGSYRLALTQFANFPFGPNLSNGFGFTSTVDGFVTGKKNWAVDIRGVTSASMVAPITQANLACLRNTLGAAAASDFSGPGQRNVLSALVNVSATYLGTQYNALSTTSLTQLVSRSNGCGERGTPDSSQLGGTEVDFVTSCPAQDAILACLRTPLP